MLPIPMRSARRLMLIIVMIHYLCRFYSLMHVGDHGAHNVRHAGRLSQCVSVDLGEIKGLLKA